jgi:aryl-alcohol dehydrogenase-like predicted oxidoreductase
MSTMITRRELLHGTAAATALLASRTLHAADGAPTASTGRGAIVTRPIPKAPTETLPVVGLGTWQTFDVGKGKAERAQIARVLERFLAGGGRVIDSSPMYGRAEEVTGDELATPGTASSGKPFLATKVWTTGKRDGIEQMKRSMKRMRTSKLDLMQVHNLLDWRTHLPVLREWKQAGTIRHLGVTHYQHGQFDLIEKLMREEQLDFIQIPYSIVDRAAEKRILPVAADTGTAVLVMTPFESGALFRKVKDKALPGFAADLDITSWAQFFLKFIIGHPAVTCPIPATRNPKHVADNLQAAYGPLPDAKQRKQMAAALK